MGFRRRSLNMVARRPLGIGKQLHEHVEIAAKSGRQRVWQGVANQESNTTRIATIWARSRAETPSVASAANPFLVGPS